MKVGRLEPAAYQMLRTGTAYADLGDGYLDSLTTRRTTKHLVRRLEQLGYRVQLEPQTVTAA